MVADITRAVQDCISDTSDTLRRSLVANFEDRMHALAGEIQETAQQSSMNAIRLRGLEDSVSNIRNAQVEMMSTLGRLRATSEEPQTAVLPENQFQPFVWPPGPTHPAHIVSGWTPLLRDGLRMPQSVPLPGPSRFEGALQTSPPPPSPPLGGAGPPAPLPMATPQRDTRLWQGTAAEALPLPPMPGGWYATQSATAAFVPQPVQRLPRVVTTVLLGPMKWTPNNVRTEFFALSYAVYRGQSKRKNSVRNVSVDSNDARISRIQFESREEAMWYLGKWSSVPRDEKFASVEARIDDGAV